MVWKDPAGAASPAARKRLAAFFAQAEQVDHMAPHSPIRISEDGTIGSTTLPMTVPGWDVPKSDGEKLIDAAEGNSGDGLEIKLGGDPIYAAQAQSSPEGLGFLGAAIVLLIAFGSVVAAGLPLVIALVGLGISSGGLIVLLANVLDVPDWTTAVSGLIGIGVGIDYSLLVLTRFRSAMARGQGPPRRCGRGRHHRGAQRDHRRLHGGDRRPRPRPHRPRLHVRGRDLDLVRGAGRDARLGHPAAVAALLPRPEGRPAANPLPRPRPEDGRRRRVAGGPLEPRGPAAPLDRRDPRHRGAARACRPRPRDAPRLPRRRQRSARHDDPPGLRPQRGGVRPRHQRPPGDRRRPARLRRGESPDPRLRTGGCAASRGSSSSPRRGSTRRATPRSSP